ncbi:ABC transporter permease [Pedobacter yulinensis]|uniref:ABC transporter permease n=1 Tax=Pedobacter yulinensis TaxID=2126353 RepID=A0A2T3HLN3_9SPHI|nr:FtsX-like permease family protein [Pedobacter yulinensis]PST83350.1 ABC transporter permease [Pedobacter yulinensis]
MNIFQIAVKSLLRNKLSTFLNIVLVAFGIGILSILLLASAQISDKLDKNAKDIDLVVGAKGSPLQLILSSIYHIDFPTGNIPAAEADALARNPLVKQAVPLALGDNYAGHRIVGTNAKFIKLYNLQVASGRFWKADLEATIGSQVAAETGLKAGDKFYGAHGLSSEEDTHRHNAYTVTGVLEPSGGVTDNLVLTNLGSIYKMHAPEEPHHEEAGEHPEEEAAPEEITALLIQYRSPMSVVLFPRMVNQSTSLQAASPAMESARLFSLIGVGVETLQWFAVLIMVIAALSVFISLYNSMKERKYDLAVMRCLGASRYKIFFLVVLESLLVTLVGSVAGLLIGHGALFLIGHYQESSQARLDPWFFAAAECWLLLAGIGIGLVASLLPALQTYRADVARILSKNM